MTNWNWTKYDYLCTDCDALIEITTLKNIREWRGWCSCGSANIINIGTSNGNAPLFEPVMKVTPPRLVKINSNPYNQYMDLNTLKEYIRLHAISLEQDMAYIQEHESNSDEMVSYLEGSIDVCNHILEAINE